MGVHSPEFDFEHVRANVDAAVRRLGVTWPVVVDNDKAIWDTFKNNYWSAKYVAGRDGKIRYNHLGEGGYQETEDVLRSLLGVDPASPRAASPGGEPSAASPAETITSETYLGTGRGTAGARPGLVTYPEPASLVTGEIRLAGQWGAGEQEVTAGGCGSRDRPSLPRRRGEPGDDAAEDRLRRRAGRARRPASAPRVPHRDTLVDDSGATFVRVDHGGLYRLVLNPVVEEHTVRLTARQPEVAAFAFTFGP